MFSHFDLYLIISSVFIAPNLSADKRFYFGVGYAFAAVVSLAISIVGGK